MIGERIHRARKGAGLSLRQVAELSGLSHTAVAKFEQGKLTPDSQRLLDLARALDVRVEYFLRPQSLSLKQTEYRKRSTLSKKLQARIEVDVLDQAERLVEVLDFFPQRPIPEFQLSAHLPERVKSLNAVDGVAEMVREEWNLGLNPLSDLTAILEERGVLVLTSSLSAQGKFDGLACTVDGLQVVVVGEDWPGDRQRFTLAHELGHLVLHGRLSESLDEEKACHRFAGAFLAPGATLRAALGERRHRVEPRELYDLKQELGMSMQAVLYRSKDLGILDSAAFRHAMQTFSRQGWRKKEPGEAVPSEQPRMLRQLVYRALAEDLIGESKAAELLGLPLLQFRAERRLEPTP